MLVTYRAHDPFKQAQTDLFCVFNDLPNLVTNYQMVPRNSATYDSHYTFLWETYAVNQIYTFSTLKCRGD